MLTTTVDGLWVLQVLCGIETVGAELGLRPHLPSIETRELALAHPVAAELLASGAITAVGEVDDPVRQWLTVLARRDAAVGVFVRGRTGQFDSDRVLMARFMSWWAVLERAGAVIRLGGAGTAHDGKAAGMLVGAEIDRLCGRVPPARMRSATIDIGEMLSCVRDRRTLRRYLVGHGLDVDQIAVLAEAADPARSTQASAVVIDVRVADASAPTRAERSAVTIIDTPRGRLISEQVNRGGKSWMLVGPGTPTAVASAVQAMVRRLPADGRFPHSRAG